MIPLSEERYEFASEPLVLNKGEVFERTLGFVLERGKKEEHVFLATLGDDSELKVHVYLRGEGEFFLTRCIRIPGKRAKISFRIFGEAEGKARISLSDDVQVTGEGATVDLQTKIVVKDEAHSAVRQRITLAPSAKTAVAAQKIEHLLLSEDAVAESLPELDVMLDDVTCTHRAATFRPSPDAMFYLFSRGMSEKEALQTLVHGFLRV